MVDQIEVPEDEPVTDPGLAVVVAPEDEAEPDEVIPAVYDDTVPEEDDA